MWTKTVKMQKSDNSSYAKIICRPCTSAVVLCYASVSIQGAPKK